MRVALCLSGQARSIDKCWPTFLKHIVNKTDCDIFMSFANDSSAGALFETKDLKYTELELIKDPSLEYLYSVARGDTTYIKHLGVMGKECTNLAILRQLYFVNRCNNLKIGYEKKNGFVYDWVIRSRADVLLGSDILDLSKLSNENIYTPDTNTHKGLNDFFAYGSSKNMDIYSNRINEIKEIDSPPFPFWNPHVELAYILHVKNNIKVALLPMDIRRERDWRGKYDSKIYEYYGKYSEGLVERKKEKIGREEKNNERV